MALLGPLCTPNVHSKFRSAQFSMGKACPNTLTLCFHVSCGMIFIDFQQSIIVP
jgi:hypothetical protein